MSTFTDEREVSKARAAELHRYDKDLLGANWKPSIGVLALSCGHSDKELRPQLPDDTAQIEPGFVVLIRAIATRI